MLKAFSVVGYVGMAAGLIGLVAMGAILSSSLWIISLQMAALALGVWARLSFGRRSFHVAANPTEGGLVTWGPYRYIRHPIYTAVAVFVLATVAGHLSWKTVACGGLVLGSLLVRIYSEEALVCAQYPEYAQYAAGTWRMIPRVY